MICLLFYMVRPYIYIIAEDIYITWPDFYITFKLRRLSKIKHKKEQRISAVLFILPGSVLLSQGETPNYHRR
jgi:hypothetical protein